MDAIFMRVHALRFGDDALAAARLSLDIIQEHIPCAGALVSFFDAARGDFIVVDATNGDAALERYAPSDSLTRVVAALGRAFSWNEIPGKTPARFAALGIVGGILAAPILVNGRMLGAIEVVKRGGGDPFGTLQESALDYVARHLATFVSSHGVVTDLAAVARFSATRASPAGRGVV